MLTIMFHTSCPPVTHLLLIPSLSLNWPTYLHSSLPEDLWLSASPPPPPSLLHTDVPCNTKLKAHNYPSWQSGDSDPVRTEDKRVNPNNAGSHGSPLILTHKLEAGCDSQTDSEHQAGSALGTPRFFNGFLYCAHLLTSPSSAVSTVCLFCSPDRVPTRLWMSSKRRNRIREQQWGESLYVNSPSRSESNISNCELNKVFNVFKKLTGCVFLPHTVLTLFTAGTVHVWIVTFTTASFH